MQKLLARINEVLDGVPAVPGHTHAPCLGVNDKDAEVPVLAEVALIPLPKLRAELDCEAWPARARTLDREVDLDSTSPRLEAVRIKKSIPGPALDRLAHALVAVTMGTPVAASRRRR